MIVMTEQGKFDQGMDEKTAKHSVDSTENNHKDLRISKNSFYDDDILFIDESDDFSVKESIGQSSERKNLSCVSTQLDSNNSDKLVTESQRKRLNSDDSQSSCSLKRHKSYVSDEKSKMKVDNCIIFADEKKNPSKLKEADSMGTHVEITSEVLQAFITARLKAFLKDRKYYFIEKLNKRTRNMQSATNLWNETAKYFERAVLDLNLLGQKIDQRRNHPSAAKNVGNHSIGTQVGECQTKQSPVIVPITSNSVASNVNGTAVQGQPVSSSDSQKRLDKVLLIQNNLPSSTSSPSLTAAQPSKTAQQGARFPVVNQTSTHLFNNCNLIDLTDEDDVSKKSGKTAPTHSLTSVLLRTFKSLSTAQTNSCIHSGALPANVPVTTKQSLPPSFHLNSKHPAPLPSHQDVGNAPPNAKCRPPKPVLRISQVSQGIVLSWNMPSLVNSEKIASYQLFAYQETETSIPKSTLWKKVGDVKALPLPIAFMLTQFQQGNKYHFAVRAVDQYGRCGSYNDSSSIFLGLGT